MPQRAKPSTDTPPNAELRRLALVTGLSRYASCDLPLSDRHPDILRSSKSMFEKRSHTIRCLRSNRSWPLPSPAKLTPQHWIRRRRAPLRGAEMADYKHVSHVGNEKCRVTTLIRLVGAVNMEITPRNAYISLWSVLSPQAEYQSNAEGHTFRKVRVGGKSFPEETQIQGSRIQLA